VSPRNTSSLKEAVPSLTRAAILASRQQRPPVLEEMQRAARALRVVLSPPILVREPAELEPAFARIAREGGGGLICPPDAFTVLHRQAIVALAAKYRLPTIYAFREPVEAGGLMAYGPSFPERFRQAATFVDKILKGARPADLPVEQPTRFELVLNLKTAKALGLTIPPSLLVRADQVIQ
jgi:putative tryptophan/tyrosine transport system substrate-binding protein